MELKAPSCFADSNCHMGFHPVILVNPYFLYFNHSPVFNFDSQDYPVSRCKSLKKYGHFLINAPTIHLYFNRSF